jgi:phospholipase/carboxylesterase
MLNQPTFPPPVVAQHPGREGDPTRPLVVLLHGRGSNERDIIGLAGQLPEGAEYLAVRAPIAEGGGYAWFANRGIGRPRAESLRETMDWFTAWLDGFAGERPVYLIGFSGGAAFAGGLILDRPQSYDGAAILYGTMPFDAGLPVDPDRLAGLKVFVGQGLEDAVIPRELLDRTWQYLTDGSGAATRALKAPGGHGISVPVLEGLRAWLASEIEDGVGASVSE